MIRGHANGVELSLEHLSLQEATSRPAVDAGMAEQAEVEARLQEAGAGIGIAASFAAGATAALDLATVENILTLDYKFWKCSPCLFVDTVYSHQSLKVS